MKRFIKTGMIILLLLAIAGMLCGCGETVDIGDVKTEEGMVANAAPEEIADSVTKTAAKSGKTSTQVTQNRKIIEYIDLTVETKTFDKLLQELDTAIKQAGGYIENSQIGGNSYSGSGNRTAELKIRIPKTKQSDFSDFVSQSGNVVSQSVRSEDVTDQYIDTQSRIKALTIEKETLEKLLKKAADVAETMSIYERLTTVIAEIESYQSRLNQMNNLIDYTTFTVYVTEVEKETTVEKQNWFVKTWNGLLESFSDVGNGLLEFLSFVIIAIPYWLVVVVITVLIILIIRRRKKKKQKQFPKN